MKLVKTVDTTDKFVMLDITADNVRERNEVTLLTGIIATNPAIKVSNNVDGVITVTCEWNIAGEVIIDMLSASLLNGCRNQALFNESNTIELASKV